MRLLVFKNSINIGIHCRTPKEIERDFKRIKLEKETECLIKDVSGTVQPSLLLVQIMESVCMPGLLYRPCRHYVFVCDCAAQFQYAAQGAPVMLIAPKVRA